MRLVSYIKHTVVRPLAALFLLACVWCGGARTRATPRKRSTHCCRAPCVLLQAIRA